jgi:hypothetical protein
MGATFAADLMRLLRARGQVGVLAEDRPPRSAVT